MRVDEPSYSLAYKFRRILVPIAPEAWAKGAVEVALDLAQRYGSRLTFLYVARGKEDPNVAKVKELVSVADKVGVEYELKVRELEVGETVASEIIRELGEGSYDLVIMSSRGYYGVAALLYHSTSIAVAIAANTSVLILR